MRRPLVSDGLITGDGERKRAREREKKIRAARANTFLTLKRRDVRKRRKFKEVETLGLARQVASRRLLSVVVVVSGVLPSLLPRGRKLVRDNPSPCSFSVTRSGALSCSLLEKPRVSFHTYPLHPRYFPYNFLRRRLSPPQRALRFSPSTRSPSFYPSSTTPRKREKLVGRM